nr:MerR family transcriptional regulator [Treponema sp.]
MTYTIGQIEDLTGVKAHVLRYWEEVVPGFTPRKDMSGRRLYSQREVDLILRLKYLINEKKFTAEGAGRQIIEEAQTAQNNSELINQIRETRQLLTEMYLIVKKNENNAE